MNNQGRKRMIAASAIALLILCLPCLAFAQDEPATPSAERAANNAWMLTSSALVLFMTAPGLAMFYSGLVRRKNVLGVMMQCLFLMGLMTISGVSGDIRWRSAAAGETPGSATGRLSVPQRTCNDESTASAPGDGDFRT